ncbi:MAG: UDP-N-acetylglucosamine 2-epimerase (non-hydrolyzing) [Actinomycetia bacterium]|nr:UDP-N-acetylglucosamine 2-epimerase (non-hydrolyzing) [Actinomycetes bacterium]
MDEPAPVQVSARVVCVVGTRPEAIKLIPVLRALRDCPFLEPFLLVTGQHRDMVRELMGKAGISINAELDLKPTGGEINSLVTQVIEGTDEVLAFLAREDPESGLPFTAAVVVHGDTSSAMAGAIAAMGRQVPVIHVEAGLRTRDWWQPWPEELNRQLVARIAAMHFAPTQVNLANLIREAVPEARIMVTGNTGIDALLWAAEQPMECDDPVVEELIASDERLVVVTAHRRESWGTGLDHIADGVAAAARATPEVHFLVPMHPNPTVRESLIPRLSDLDNVWLTEPLDYIPFAHLLRRAEIVVTDSGGIQEEAPAFDTPVLVCRAETERTEGLEAGTLRLVGTNPNVIRDAITELLNDRLAYESMALAANPYGDGHAAQRIVAAMVNLLGKGDAPVSFGPGYDKDAVLEAAGYGSYGDSHSTLRPAGWSPPVAGRWWDQAEAASAAAADTEAWEATDAPPVTLHSPELLHALDQLAAKQQRRLSRLGQRVMRATSLDRD